jgi:glutathione S-transferase
MKLYMHPVSMTSRPVRLLIAEKGLPVDEQLVDLFTGEHLKEPFARINPNKLVPVLEDGDFRLTESSAILKYLAERFDLPEYPKDPGQRARVNELMDWFNTNFYRNFGYGLCYPQLFPHHKRRSDEAHAATIEWGKAESERWLQILNDHWLGRGNPYLCGDRVTIADYFGVCLITLGEIVRCDLSRYPSVAAWIARMKSLKSWPAVNEALYGFAEAVKGQEFVRI